MWWFAAGCAGPEAAPEARSPEREERVVVDYDAPSSLDGCVITRVVHEDGDGHAEYTCVETWRGDEAHVLRRDCVGADGRRWGEENDWDAFGCPTRSATWDGAPDAAVVLTYTCDEHHHVVDVTRGDHVGTYVNVHDGFGRLLSRTSPGPDPEYAAYTDVVWWWRWGADGRLLAEGFHHYPPGSYSKTYRHDVFGAVLSSEYVEQIGHYPPTRVDTTYDELGRPLEAAKEYYAADFRIEWIYADDAVSPVEIRETSVEDGSLRALETRSWTCD